MILTTADKYFVIHYNHGKNSKALFADSSRISVTAIPKHLLSKGTYQEGKMNQPKNAKLLQSFKATNQV